MMETGDGMDPIEREVAQALRRAGIDYERNRELEPGRYTIDFYLPKDGLWIEICQFYTSRKIKQLSRLPDVILIQGIGAAAAFARLLNGKRSDKTESDQ